MSISFAPLKLKIHKSGCKEKKVMFFKSVIKMWAYMSMDMDAVTALNKKDIDRFMTDTHSQKHKNICNEYI